jgi:hypothetical protein
MFLQKKSFKSEKINYKTKIGMDKLPYSNKDGVKYLPVWQL